MQQLHAVVAAHTATLGQMHERIGRIEARLRAIETRLSRLERDLLAGGAVLGGLMTVYKFL